MYRIISDSSIDRPTEIRSDDISYVIPYEITIDDQKYMDTLDLDLNIYSEALRRCNTFNTTCLTPDAFYEALDHEGDSFIITISSQLSATYQSAVLAKKMIQDKNPDKRIHIFDSEASSAAQALIYQYIREAIDEGKTFDEIVETVEAKMKKMDTIFILDSLSNLRKSGRLSHIRTLLANTLNIYPILGENGGKIVKVGQARGKKRALRKFVDLMKERSDGQIKERTVYIHHADNLEEALVLKKDIMERLSPAIVQIHSMGAANYLYADYRGIVVAYEK